MVGKRQSFNDYPKDYIGNLFKDKGKQDIYDKYKEKYPLDIEALIKELDIKIEYKDFPDGISGRFNGNNVIEVNKCHSLTRQRFTLAHELGHYLKQHEGNCHRQSLLTYNSKEQIEESEANLFARSILMPADEIDNFFQEYKDSMQKENFNFIKHLVEKFNVSTDALKVRLITLGFVEGW